MNKPVIPADLDDLSGPLYAPGKTVYPQSVSGTFRNIKWGLMAVTLAVYYILPFVRWDRGPNAPSQAVLIDFPSRRFYFFFIELWPQEIYYFTGLLIIAAMTLFLMNAIGGRIWCGYLCPQTVWTDLFYAVERFVEGDRRERMRKAAGAAHLQRVREIATKHAIWLFIAWWTGGAWVLYFADAPTLVKQLATGTAPAAAYMWIAVLTFTTYVLAGHMREQVCVYMCPWPRIQAALDGRMGAQRHLPARSRRAAHLDQEGRRTARPWRAGRRLHRLPPVRGGVSDRHRYPRRRPARLHHVRPVHRCLRQRDEEGRSADRPHRL